MILALAFTSCNVNILNTFSKQKYTNYKLVSKSTPSPGTPETVEPTVVHKTNNDLEMNEPAPAGSVSDKVENPVAAHAFVPEVKKSEASANTCTPFIIRSVTGSAVIRHPGSIMAGESQVLIIVLCILIPPLAVGLVHGIGDKFWINILLTLLFVLPGIIHALIVCT